MLNDEEGDRARTRARARKTPGLFWNAVTCHRFISIATCRGVFEEEQRQVAVYESGDKSPHSKKDVSLLLSCPCPCPCACPIPLPPLLFGFAISA